jgi:hypothetical protein
MKKLILLVVATGIISFNSFSQTVQQKIDKKVKDPKTAENAARADVFISKNKSIFDSTTTAKAKTNNTASVKKKRNKTCNKKS